ncbi:hypothetical protein PTKIN_Ptkin12aG0010000 [Pterospermum kingtungense]
MKKAELVFIPWPGMGHLVSPVQLAKLLVDLNPNLSITLIKSPTDPKVTPYVDSLAANTTTSRTKFIVLPQPEIDRDVSPAKLMSHLNQTPRPLVKEAVTNIVKLSEAVPDSPIVKNTDSEFIVPSFINPVSTKFFPSVIFMPENFCIIHEMAKGFREVKGIMVNTILELESHAVNSLSDSMLPSIYSVGPILNLEIHQDSDTIMEWLDKQPHSSVVFLCFGSRGSFDVDQVREIACALEQSGYRFLWSLLQAPEPIEKIG